MYFCDIAVDSIPAERNFNLFLFS